MVNRRLWIGALGVAAILLVASVIYIFCKPAPQPSISEQMALTSDDLGAGWTSHTSPEPYGDDESDTRLMNDTYNTYIWLVVYDNISECEHHFENESELYHANRNLTFLNITLGDEAFLCYYGTVDEPIVHLIFTKDRVWCNFYASPVNYKGKPWWIDTTSWIAELQLEKIDQYLAQHPGVS